MKKITSINETPENIQRAYDRLLRRYPGLKVEFSGYKEGKNSDELYLRDRENQQHVIRALRGQDQAYYSISDSRGRKLDQATAKQILKKLQKP